MNGLGEDGVGVMMERAGFVLGVLQRIEVGS
jgi:hypothetical protein